MANSSATSGVLRRQMRWICVRDHTYSSTPATEEQEGAIEVASSASEPQKTGDSAGAVPPADNDSNDPFPHHYAGATVISSSLEISKDD